MEFLLEFFSFGLRVRFFLKQPSFFSGLPLRPHSFLRRGYPAKHGFFFFQVGGFKVFLRVFRSFGVAFFKRLFCLLQGGVLGSYPFILFPQQVFSQSGFPCFYFQGRAFCGDFYFLRLGGG